jgi:phosphate transport system protein
MSENQHLSSQFDADLDAVCTRVLYMGGLVERQINQAIEGMSNGDLDLLTRVSNGDHEVNALEVEVDQACSQIIAKRQPAARDLRLLMAIIKTITDLERAGDEADKIARMARRMHTREGAPQLRIADLRRSAEDAVDMLRRALDAFARLDTAAAAKIAREDRAIDDQFRAILRQLITFVMEDPRTISMALEIVFIAKAIERIGDHAKNIGEYVIYIVKGTDVRHVTLEALEREALS